MSKDKKQCGAGGLIEVNTRLIHKIRTACLQHVGTLDGRILAEAQKSWTHLFPRNVFLNLTATLSTVEIFPSSSDMTGQQAPL